VKAQCDRCREIVPLEFTVEGNGIRVRCPACAGDYVVTGVGPAGDPAPAATPVPRGLGVGGMTCPKCGQAQRPAAACRRCGLLVASWRPEDAAQGPAPGPAREAAALWTACEGAWHESPRHDAFIDHCRRAGLLALAAARYGQRAGPDGVAAARLAQIRTLAEQGLFALRSEPKRKSSRALIVLAVVFIVLFVALAGRLAP
jgi:hypothetical protein